MSAKPKNVIAARLKQFDSSAIRYAFELAEKLKDPIDLSIGFPEDNTPRAIKRTAVKAIRDNRTRYTPSNGIPELRKAIAEKLVRENKIHTDYKQVAVVPGLTTAILVIYLAILDPGDEIIIPEPFFSPYSDLANMLGAKPVLVDTFPTFQLTAELLEKCITKKTKAIMVNSPNNPTGVIYTSRELRKIANLAKKHNLIIISDEIYEHFSYDKRHFSIGSIYTNTITMNGFSKAYAMTGWRLGYINGPLEIIEAVNELLQYTVFAPSSISQYAALRAIRYQPKQLTRKYRKKRDLMVGLLSRDFRIEGAEGAFYLFLQLPSGIKDLDFVDMAIKRELIILPGRAFSSREDYIRIAFGNTRDKLIRGANIIHDLINSKV